MNLPRGKGRRRGLPRKSYACVIATRRRQCADVAAEFRETPQVIACQLGDVHSVEVDLLGAVRSALGAFLQDFSLTFLSFPTSLLRMVLEYLGLGGFLGGERGKSDERDGQQQAKRERRHPSS